MFPRNRSIFHLGEEGEREQNSINGVTVQEAREGPVIGLRALIQHHEKESKVSVLIKSSVKPSKKPPPAAADGRQILSPNFLKSCFSCKKELSLQKEVYMYRGDQGFCSVECRYKQILIDERKYQDDESKREQFRVHYQYGGSKVEVSSRRTKIHTASLIT